MTTRATVRWLVLSSASIFVAVLLVVATSNISFTSADSRSIDTETISRLTGNIASPDGIHATSDITGTNAAMLAAGTLLDPTFYNVDLPVVMK